MVRTLDWLRRNGGENRAREYKDQSRPRAEDGRASTIRLQGGSEPGVSMPRPDAKPRRRLIALSVTWNDPAAALDETKYRGPHEPPRRDHALGVSVRSLRATGPMLRFASLAVAGLAHLVDRHTSPSRRRRGRLAGRQLSIGRSSFGGRRRAAPTPRSCRAIKTAAPSGRRARRDAASPGSPRHCSIRPPVPRRPARRAASCPALPAPRRSGRARGER